MKKYALIIKPGGKPIVKDGNPKPKLGEKLTLKSTELELEPGQEIILKKFALILPSVEQLSYKQPQRGRISERYKIST